MTNITIKKYLLDNNIKQRLCEDCKLESWQDQIIPLELHHIDGNNKNNELSNLKLICPNCHALTENYRGKNKLKCKTKREIIPDQVLIDLIPLCYSIREVLLKAGLVGAGGNYTRIHQVMTKYNLTLKVRQVISEEQRKKVEEKIEFLRQNFGYIQKFERKTKIEWPNKEKLEEELRSKPMSKIAQELGVSDNSIRKRAKKYGIDIQSISPWSKKHGGCSRT